MTGCADEGTSQREHRTGYMETDDKIDKIIRCTVLFSSDFEFFSDNSVVTMQTGMITSIWAIVDLCVYLSDVFLPSYLFQASIHDPRTQPTGL
jgi:hypothetical protein